MALRNFPLEEVGVIEQILLPHLNNEKSCGKRCTSHSYCQSFKGSVCTQCRLQYSKYSKETKCWLWRN
ncbi:hypothetical protein RND71_027108 [Anisodus tanguticus]|nr:hypothetical protein RND71_027108 [Anisodus tanguticus]